MCGSMASQVPLNSANQPEQGKGGLGDRQPFLVISPYTKSNYVDHTLTDQSSVVKFIEYNWGLPALGNGASDTAAGSILSMFNFSSPNFKPLFLNPITGQPIGLTSFVQHFQNYVRPVAKR
jgi:phospholipase C